jgi:para-nitrobenzyl esterase
VGKALLVAGIGVVAALVVMAVGVVTGSRQTGANGDATLVGPVWEWTQFAGEDGSSIVPEDPSAYSVQFSEDGSVAIRADCNRGIGTYAATSGSLMISVGAVTRAFCPEESLGDRYLRDLGFVRTYVIEDGMLYLNLLADAGNLVHRQRSE